MKFLEANWKALILVFFLIMGEAFHLLFEGMPFWDEGVNLDDAVYFLISQLGELTLIPAIIIFLMVPSENRSSRGITFGLVLWNLKELFDEISYMRAINLNVFEVNDSFWGQIILICTIIVLSWFGFSRWKS